MIQSIEASISDTGAAIAALAGVVVIGVLKAAERFGYLRTPSAWRTESEALMARLNSMERRVGELETELATVRAENSELRSRPDLTTMAQLIRDHDEHNKQMLSALIEVISAVAVAVGATSSVHHPSHGEPSI